MAATRYPTQTASRCDKTFFQCVPKRPPHVKDYLSSSVHCHACTTTLVSWDVAANPCRITLLLVLSLCAASRSPALKLKRPRGCAVPLNSVGRPCAGDLVRFLHSSSVHCVVDGWNLEKADMSASPICLFIYLFISSDFPIGWVCLLVAIGLLSVSLDESSSFQLSVPCPCPCPGPGAGGQVRLSGSWTFPATVLMQTLRCPTLFQRARVFCFW